MSICPKNKSSKGHRDQRRANWKMSAPTLVKCSHCGALMQPHMVCKKCGYYNKKNIVELRLDKVLEQLHWFEFKAFRLYRKALIFAYHFSILE